jgi:decaprenyl-phosphate phosphoribosyltransferase
MILNVIKLMRPHQYIKNLFIFLPLFFSREITDIPNLLNTIIAFIAFSLSASAVYILNDYHDIHEDKLHQKKKNRPLASGAISKQRAIIIMVVLAISGIAIMLSLSLQAVSILATYILMNILYSFHLKHVAIIDVTTIAIGFVLRLFVGAIAAGLPLSSWIVLMTFLLALFLALAKRRDDVLIYLESGKKMRKVIDGYNLQFLDNAMAIMAAVVIVAYSIYTTTTEVTARFHSQYLYLSVVFVILGIMRYLQITFVYLDSGSPTSIVIKDRFMKLTILGWVAFLAVIIY